MNPVVQQLMKEARNGTTDSLEKTTFAMIRKISFLQNKDSSGEGKDDAGYVDMLISELKHPPAHLSPMPQGLSNQQIVRRLILSSIVESERNYLDSLKRIIQEYQMPLLQTCIVNPKKLSPIFYRLREIYQCHCMFNIAMASRVAEWDHSEKIGDLFVASFSKSMVLDVYSDYINNFTNAMALIKKACLSKPAFLEFLKKKQASSPDRITLHGLMVKPIQRFPQFILLLQDMLKHTPRAHPDRLPLQMALTDLETLAEKLNEKKRLNEQVAEIQQLAGSVGDRTLNKLLNTKQRHIIQSEVLTETVYGEKGQILKSRARKVFLLNDMLICADINLKGPPNISSLVPTGPRYKVKWSAPLLQIQVVEVGQESPVHLGSGLERLSYTSSINGRVSLGPPGLYQKLEELQHDLAVVEEISQLVGRLRGAYQNLNTTVSQDWCLALQRLIRIKEEEIQCANKCNLRLSISGKPDKSGQPVNFMVVFNTPTPLSKISWVNRLHLAKIALREENTPGWDCAEDEGRTKTPVWCPLLACQVPIFSTKAHMPKPVAAVHSPALSTLLGFCPASPSPAPGYLWVVCGGDCTSQGRVEIFSLHGPTPRLVKSIELGAPAMCLEYMWEPCPALEDEEREEREEAQSVATISISICVGLQDGKILVYGSVNTAVQCLMTFFSPESCAVMCLKHSPSFLFAGLANGKVAVYPRKTGDRLWDVESYRLVAVGSAPICTLLTLDHMLWASCANRVTLIQGHSLQTQSFEAHPNPKQSVSHMVHSGGGVWMAFSQDSSIHLFHTETLEQLQEVNLSTHSMYLTPDQGTVRVTSLLICHGLLWVGTAQGIIITFPVPTLEGIPKIRGKGMTSLNAHRGPVDFLVASQNNLSSNMLRQDSRDGNEEPQDTSSETLGGTLLLPKGYEDKANGILLQYRLPSTCQLPGNLLTANSVQELSREEVSEHSPEDGSIYELSEDPDVWLRKGTTIGLDKEGQNTRHSKAMSAAVFSGGKGFCRIGGEDSGASIMDSQRETLMVWQLPLTLTR